MRLVRGTTLKDQIAPAGMDPGRALRLLRQVSDALDAAHEAGLVHRDIKPQNILVGSRDHAFLADFGLTRTGDRGSGLTRTGQRMGTPDYMAPEQIRGDAPAPPADHYAVAAVLYECLTGDVPFPMATDTAVFWAHMADPPPLVSARRPDLPRRLDDVLQRGLAKHPAERYPTAVALVDAASSALGAPTELGIAAPVQRRSRTTQRGAPAALPTELRTAPETEAPRPATPLPAAATKLPVAAETQLPVATETVVGETKASAPVTQLHEVEPEPEVVLEPDVDEVLEPEPEEVLEPEPEEVLEAEPEEVLEPEPEPSPRETIAAAPAPRVRVRRGRIAAVAAVALAAAGGAFVAGRAGSEPAPAVPAPKTVSAKGINASVPGSWRTGAAPAALRELGLAEASASLGEAGVALARPAADDPTLLPATLLDSLTGDPPAAQRVRLGSATALRYRGVRTPAGSLTILAAPTTDGVATLTCWGATPAADCDRAAASLRITSGSAVAPGPDAGYAERLDAALAALNARRRDRLRDLRAARTPAGQASRAAAVADAHAAARRSLARVTPPGRDRAAHAALLGALASERDAYDRLARAARRARRAAWRSARTAATAADRELAAALEALAAAGYSLT